VGPSASGSEKRNTDLDNVGSGIGDGTNDIGGSVGKGIARGDERNEGFLAALSQSGERVFKTRDGHSDGIVSLGDAP
jgi:hypothetical protein